MTFTIRILVICASILASTYLNFATSQNVLDPNDPILNYDAANKPTPPGWMQIGKWVRTPNTAVRNRNTTWYNAGGINRFKAYIFQNISFRLMYPKSYNPTANDGKKYPLMIFFHGKGENARAPLYDANTGLNYDNEFQLIQGPREFDIANQNGSYDGYVLVPQITDAFYQGILDNIMLIVNYMITNNKVDPYHIVANGLSEGGIAAWEMVARFPTYISSSTPMSSPTPGITFGIANDPNYLNNIKFTPIWMSHGLLDLNPSPAQVQELKNNLNAAGANFKTYAIPNAAHSTWYQMWAHPDFWPFVNRSYSSNPWMLGSPKYFWPGVPINEVIGIAPGFEQYEWRRNGILIGSGPSNTLNIALSGKYEARVKRNGLWSDWSVVPILVRPGFYEAEAYVAMSGVQVENTTDNGGGQNVGWIDFGNYMDYTIHPNQGGTFKLELRVASQSPGGRIEIRGQDSSVLATVNVPVTGGYQMWETVSTTVTIPGGIQNIRLKSVSAIPWNINWLQFGLESIEIPLPVRFVYFNAKCVNNGLNLQWKTAMEQDTRNFSIQRSTNGVSWSEIGSVLAAGQSSSEKTYSFVDNSAGSQQAFYRIMQYDIDGRSSITGIVRGNCSSSTASINIYPNPSNSHSTLSISLQQSSKVSLVIIDAKGAVISQRQMQLPSGNSSVSLDLNTYPKGVYTIQVHYNNTSETLKLIKK